MAGKGLHEAGQVLTYYHHAIEPIRMGEQTILDYIYAQTDATSLQDQLDTYRIQRGGGGGPMEWCQKHDKRLPLLHMKDCCITTNNQPAFAGIDSGNLDRTRIIAAQESGCQWFIIEQGTSPAIPSSRLSRASNMSPNAFVHSGRVPRSVSSTHPSF